MLNALALKPGEEQFESYYSLKVQKDLIHYNYRSLKGELFSCSGETLEKCQILCRKYAQNFSWNFLKHDYLWRVPD